MQRSGGSADKRLQGAIEGFDAATGAGVIAGPGGVRYGFAVGDLAPGLVPAVWQRVEFTLDGADRAIAVTAGSLNMGRKLDFARLVSRTVGALRAQWATFLIGSAIFVGIPSAVAGWGGQAAMGDTATVGVSAYVLGTIGYILGNYLLAGLVTKAVLNGIRGKSTPVRETVNTAVRTALPLLGLGVVATLGVFIGALFFLIPALVLSVWWSVARVVLVAEGRGVMESLGRSTDLSQGYRWQIFGLMVVYSLTSWLLTWAATSALAATLGGLSMTAWTVAIMISYAVVNSVTDVIYAAGTASLYDELRTASEGDSEDHLAAVFD